MPAPMTTQPRAARAALVAVMAITLGGCGATPEPSGPHLRIYDNEIDMCAGVGLGDDVILEGDPADPRVAWLTNGSGQRTDIVWPRGYTARFDPDLEVLRPSGIVAYRAGDHIDGVCVTTDPRIYLIER